MWKHLHSKVWKKCKPRTHSERSIISNRSWGCRQINTALSSHCKQHTHAHSRPLQHGGPHPTDSAAQHPCHGSSDRRARHLAATRPTTSLVSIRSPTYTHTLATEMTSQIEYYGWSSESFCVKYINYNTFLCERK